MPGDHPPIHLPACNVYFSENTVPGDRVTGLPAMNFFRDCWGVVLQGRVVAHKLVTPSVGRSAISRCQQRLPPDDPRQFCGGCLNWFLLYFRSPPPPCRVGHAIKTRPVRRNHTLRCKRIGIRVST